jgi:hypothetical protein
MHRPSNAGARGDGGLMQTIKLKSLERAPMTTPFRVVAFTVSTADLRTVITDRNAALRAKNPHLAGTLRAITGSETDRALEDIFIANYYRVASSMFCNQARGFIQILCYGLGIFSGSSVFLTIENFVRDLWAEIDDAVIEFYEASIKPENIVFNCSEFVMRTSTPKSEVISKIFGGAAAVCAERVKDNVILTGLLEIVQRYFRGTFSVFFSIYNVPTLNKLLDDDIPESETPGQSITLELARAYCESKVKKAQEDTAARAANAPPRRGARRDHRADSVPNDDDDSVLPSAPSQSLPQAPPAVGDTVVAGPQPAKPPVNPAAQHQGWVGTMYADD